LLFIFVLINLIWFGFLYNHFGSLYQTNLAKKKNCQNIEKFQIKTWLEGLKNDNRPKSSKSLSELLNRNSQQITNLNFLSTFCQLPELAISGISILFLFLYYQIYRGGRGDLS